MAPGASQLLLCPTATAYPATEPPIPVGQPCPHGQENEAMKNLRSTECQGGRGRVPQGSVKFGLIWLRRLSSQDPSRACEQVVLKEGAQVMELSSNLMSLVTDPPELQTLVTRNPYSRHSPVSS